jgi:phage tail tape-measure protein
MTNDSLAQLAQLTTTHRSTYDSRGAPGGKKRAAFFVGSGVFAAATAAVLTFFMLNANNSIGRSQLPLVASVNRPVPNKVFPWQQAAEPTRPAQFVRNEPAAPRAADLDTEAEAASENFEVEPGHPGPPQPNPPPGPSEPPSAESPEAVDE